MSGKTSDDFGHGDAKFLPYLNIFNNPIADINFLESTEIDKSQNEIKYGDVFFTTSSETPEEVGMSSVWLGNSENIYLNSFCFGFRHLIDFNPYYFGYLLRSDTFRNPVTILAQGISRFNISKNKVMEIEIPLPEKQEQEKIGQLFYKLDSLITLHQRKYEKLQQIKKSLLAKMFPAEGDSTPKIRFKGFTEAWEQRKLGDIGKTFTGLSGKTSDDFGHGDAKFLPYLNIFNNPIADINFLESTEIDKSQNEIKYGDVFFTTSSETPEEVGMSSVWLGNSENIYLNSFCFGFRHLIDFNPYYFGYLLRSDTFRNPVTILAQGISRFNISKNKVMEIEIPLPEKQEQEKIGQLFYKLDSLITLHQRKQL